MRWYRPPYLFNARIFKSPNRKQQIEKIKSFSLSCIDAAQNRVPAIKPQVALFEKFGPEGMEVLQQIGKNARSAGLLAIMDAKRGDIGSTSAAYADAWLGEMQLFIVMLLPSIHFLGLIHWNLL